MKRVGKDMQFVYVVSRADGSHKIGVTGDVEARRETLSRMYPKLRPLKVVHFRRFDRGAPTVEKIAHAQMIAAGYAIGQLEWFQAKQAECVRAVDMAAQLFDDVGGESGWLFHRAKYGAVETVQMWLRAVGTKRGAATNAAGRQKSSQMRSGTKPKAYGSTSG